MEIDTEDVIVYFETQGYTVKRTRDRIPYYILEKDGKQKTLDVFEYCQYNKSIWKKVYQRLIDGGLIAYQDWGQSYAYIYTKKDIESKHQTYSINWKRG